MCPNNEPLIRDIKYKAIDSNHAIEIQVSKFGGAVRKNLDPEVVSSTYFGGGGINPMQTSAIWYAMNTDTHYDIDSSG